MSNNVLLLFKWTVLLIILFGSAGGCATPSPTPTVQQLRIMNLGNTDISGLIVLFPGPRADAKATRVMFGDVPAGETTEYRDIPSGVYRYAAYEYKLDNHLVHQAVTDWVGELPMKGKKFTYQIKLDPKMEPGGQIQMLKVLVDVP